MVQGSLNGPNSEMNVTPLIDVLLVLLIIFMVVLPHRYSGEKAEIPLRDTHDENKPAPDDVIVLQIHQGAQERRPVLELNREEVSWENLEARLSRIFTGRAEKVAYLRGDPEVDFDYVAQVLDIAHRAGADRVGLLGAKEW